MPTWKLTLEYDGSRYSGSQEQENARTVMGDLRQAAEGILGRELEMQAAGRTDAGVHALGQVVHLRARKRIPLGALLSALNHALPADIAVVTLEAAPSAFHARHDAISRTYRYQIARRKLAFAKRYVWWVKEPLDLERMRRAARLLEGRHDFACFRALDPSKPSESSVVVIDSASLAEEEDLIVFRITGSHFLWRMVRRIVGSLVKLGRGEITENDFRLLVNGRCEARLDVASWTAPAAGLFLERVEYRQQLRS